MESWLGLGRIIIALLRTVDTGRREFGAGNTKGLDM